jgi:antigen flippase
MHAATAFGADSALTIATNVLLAAEGMVSGIMVARLLGPKGRGELAAIQTFSGFIAAVAILGMTEAVVYYCARNPQRAGRYIGSAATIALLASVPVLVGAYLAMPILLAAESRSVVSAARWYLLIAPVYALVAVPAHSLRGRGDFVAWNGMRLVPNLIWILVLAAAFCVAVRSATILASLYVAAQAVVIFPVFYIVAKRVDAPFRPSFEDWGGMVSYGLPCTLTSLPQMLNLRLDQIAMAVLLPPHELGTYAVAVAWSGAAAPLLSALGATLLPAIASRADPGASACGFSAGARLASLLAVCTCVVLIALTPLAVVLLFGASYRAAVPAALVLVPAGSILALNSVLEEGLRGLGHPYSVLNAELTGLVITAVSLALTLGPLGIMGGALSSLIGYSTVFVALLINAGRLIGVSPAALLWPGVRELQVGMRRVQSLVRAVAAPTE